MASGGARSRSGPAPDPNALRRDRPDDAAGWIDLPGPRTDPAPEWPLPDQTSREAILWDREWTRPQAHEWARLALDLEVALYVRAFAEAEKPDAASNLRNYVRMEQENLGISINGLTRHRWRIAGAPATSRAKPSTKPTGTPRRSSARDRFKVVPSIPAPAEDDDPPPF